MKKWLSIALVVSFLAACASKEDTALEIDPTDPDHAPVTDPVLTPVPDASGTDLTPIPPADPVPTIEPAPKVQKKATKKAKAKAKAKAKKDKKKNAKKKKKNQHKAESHDGHEHE